VKSFKDYVEGLPKSTTFNPDNTLNKAFGVVLASMKESIDQAGRKLSVLAQNEYNALGLTFLCDHF